uniref:Uncharacterized protein n=1 Tax=Ditylenchus dipsaci TaxID=166011 RepID=A0A915EP29_9BILA
MFTFSSIMTFFLGVEMCLAAGECDLQALKAWTEAKVDLSTADYDGRTALHVASAKALEEVVEFLCANGADPEAKDHFGRTSLDECSNLLTAIKAKKENPAESNITLTSREFVKKAESYHKIKKKEKIVMLPSEKNWSGLKDR